MAKRKSTRARSGKPRTDLKQLHLDLIGAQAAIRLVAGRLVICEGIYRDMATILYRLALHPIDKAVAEMRS